MIKRFTLAAAGALLIAAGVSAQADDKAATPTVMTLQQHFEMMQQQHKARFEQARALHAEFVKAQQEAYRKLAETAPLRTLHPTPEQMEAHADAQQALIENQMDYQARLYGMPSPKVIEAQMKERRAAWDAETQKMREWNEKREELFTPWMKHHREMMEKHQAEMRAWHDKQRAARFGTAGQAQDKS